MMYDYTRIRLCDQPERLDEAADWFAQRWGIAESAYRQSMQESLRPRDAVPHWYLVLTPQGRIAAGAGVIENDFHERRDLAPNVCALFVEPEDRGRGIAGFLLEAIRRDMALAGYGRLYLLTDHAGFYERYGWRLTAMVPDGEGVLSRMYEAPTLP